MSKYFEDPADVDKLEDRRSQIVYAEDLPESLRDHRVTLFFLEACQSAQAEIDPSASVAARLRECGVASVVLFQEELDPQLISEAPPPLSGVDTEHGVIAAS